MADAKITALDELTSLETTDLVAVVDDPAGSPVTKKATIGNVLKTSGLVLTAPQINDTSSDHQYVVGVSELTADRTVTLPLLTGNDEFVFQEHGLTADANENFTYHTMARQAIINGNFDVWQRGTTVTVFGSGGYLADRWQIGYSVDGGTNPTIVESRQTQTAGALAGSYYFYRINVDGAGSGYGADADYRLQQKIEHGTRLLAGASRTVTVSFWAKSDITNKKIGVTLYQNYGTGGTPTADENIVGESWTLTSSWTKYTHTFTTNTLASKTFGTGNNDYLRLVIGTMWGSTTDAVYGADGAETFVGAGNIDIAQVQLCAGSVALPFQPKSYEDELRACQRYCYGVTTEQTGANIAIGSTGATNTGNFLIFLPVTMRAVPVITATASDWIMLESGGVTVNCNTILLSSTGCSSNIVQINATEAGTSMTVGKLCYLKGDGTTGRVFILSAEL